jgi:hypothetical protein
MTTLELTAKEEVEEVIKKLEAGLIKLKEFVQKGVMESVDADDHTSPFFGDYTKIKIKLLNSLEKVNWKEYDQRVVDAYKKFGEDLGL